MERQVTLGEVEPWPEPVDVASVLDDIVGKIREFLVVTDEQIDAMALWAANTHTYAFFDFVPYLLLTAPEKRTAKTRAQDVLAPITNTPLVASHLTAATAFRALDKFHPTLFIDEAHNYIKESKDHEAVMTGGFQKGKPVLRCAETTYEPTLFDTFGPKCFASIGDLQDTVMDRSIIIRMRRKLPTEHRRWWFRGARIEREELRPIARKLRRWAEDSAETLQRYEPTANDVPHELFVNDRAVDAWLPLFAIAEQAGSTWPERARRAAVALSVGAAATAPETTGTELLRNIRSIFYRTTSDGQPLEPLDVLGLSDLCARLTARPEWLWASYSNGKPLTAYRLLALLKPYGVAPTQRRVRHGRARGLWRDDLEPVWARYLDDEAVSRLRETVSQPPETPPDGGDGHSCRNGETRETGETRLQTSTFLGTSSTHFVSRDRETTRETTGETSRPKWTDVDQAVFEQRWAQLAHTP